MRKNILQKMKFQQNCLVDTLPDVPDDADSDSENDSDSSIIGNGQNKVVTVNKVQTRVTMTMKH